MSLNLLKLETRLHEYVCANSLFITTNLFLQKPAYHKKASTVITKSTKQKYNSANPRIYAIKETKIKEG